jgi:hypothetical protein
MHSIGQCGEQVTHVCAERVSYYKEPPDLAKIKKVLYTHADGSDDGSAGSSAGGSADRSTNGSAQRTPPKLAVHVHGAPGIGKTAMAEALYTLCMKVRSCWAPESAVIPYIAI